MKKYFAILTSTKLGNSLMKAGLLVLILPYISLSQIKIEERVEIEAQTYQLNSPTNPTEPTYTYILSWPTSQYWRGTIKIVSCYGDTTTTGWTSGGYATITMPGRGHHIFNMITERWYYDNQKGWGWYEDLHPEAVRKVLINNQEWNQFNLLGAMIGTIDIPLLRMNDDICDSGYAKLEIVPTNWSDCEEIGWLPIDELKLRITKGTEFASFFNKRTNTNLGSQVQINPFVELENLRLFFGFEWEEDGFDEVVIKFNENVPADSIPVNIEVEAEINGVVFSGENIFFHTDRPLIKAEINPNKITAGEETSINIELLNRCAVDPFTTLNIEIIEGQEFGNLINPYTNEKTKIITNLFQRWGYAWAPYLADNAPIDEIKEVTIRVSTSDPSFPPRDIKLYILPSPIYAYTVPEVLGADEEADVIIKKRNPDGTLEDFPPEQTFELAVLDGCVNGNFKVGDSINVYFADALQPIKFVTADSLDSEVDSVLIRVGTDIEGYMRPIGNIKGEEEKRSTEKQKGLDTLRAGFEKMMAEKKAEAEKKEEGVNEPQAPVVTECASDNPTHPFNFKLFVPTKNEALEILLGETKYFQAKRNTSTSELKIEEIEPDVNGVPQQKTVTENGWEWLTSDVWETNPVSVVECDTCGKKMGVYWEKEKPMVNGQNLPTGLIRLVGRYWHLDSTYVVRLRAKRNNDSIAVNIRTVKPDLLGDSNDARNLNNGIDINNNDYSIDSMCNKWAGIYGLPPQYIKGQYVGESVYLASLGRVTPAYRYEAWTTQFDVQDNADVINGPFWVTWGNMGTGEPVPTNHSNVKYMTYETTTPRSVWYFIDRYSNIEHSPPPGGWRVLGRKNDNNSLHFYDYSRPVRPYRDIRNRIYRARGLNPLEQNPVANEEARIEFIQYMKYDYSGGLENIVAQSRVASSYGPIQPLYTTVLGYGYPGDQRPEELNNLDIFWPFALDHYSDLLRQRVGNELNNWQGGFEAVLTRVYQGWNPGKTGYGRSVITRGNEFPPMLEQGE